MFHPRSWKPLFAFSLFLLLLAAVLFTLREKQVKNGSALWQIVGRCFPDMQANHLPAPCVSVDLTRRDAVYKDASGKTQFLLLPTDKITGVEDHAILKPEATNYFSDAWESTALVSQILHRSLPRTDFAVAINSISGRTQDQLHIHVDCIQPTVKSEMEKLGPQIGTTWQKLPVKLMGDQYRALWLPGEHLDARNPFLLLAGSLPRTDREMAGHTLVLAGAERSGSSGFILLDAEAPAFAVALAPVVRLGYASGEKLEDHQCAVGNP